MFLILIDAKQSSPIITHLSRRIKPQFIVMFLHFYNIHKINNHSLKTIYSRAKHKSLSSRLILVTVFRSSDILLPSESLSLCINSILYTFSYNYGPILDMIIFLLLFNLSFIESTGIDSYLNIDYLNKLDEISYWVKPLFVMSRIYLYC